MATISQGPPGDSAAWEGTGLVLLVTAAPLLFVLWTEPGTRSIGDASTIAGLVSFPSVLAAAVVLHLVWRHGDRVVDRGDPSDAPGEQTDHVEQAGRRADSGAEPLPAWLSAGLLVASAQAFALAGAQVGFGEAIVDRSVLLVVLAALFVLALCVVLRLTSGPAPVARPALLATVVAGGSAVLVYAVPSIDAGRSLGLSSLSAVGGAAATVLLATLVYLTRMLHELAEHSLPAWAQRRAVVGFLALVVSPLPWLAGTGHWAVGVLALALQLTAVALLMSLALALIGQRGLDRAETLASLRRQVDEAERRNQAHRERLHELKASIAGIASATRLIHDPAVRLPPERMVQLRDVMESELTRLQRMAHGDATQIGDWALAGVLESVVLAQRIQGRNVEWSQTDAWVRADREYLAEVLTTLLTNAARHAPGSPVRISVASDETRVSIRVSDFGPGVPPDVAERLFTFGGRGEGSPGLGIGLAVAQRLMADSDGELRLVTDTVCGATFEITLPAARAASHAPEHATRSTRGPASASA